MWRLVAKPQAKAKAKASGLTKSEAAIARYAEVRRSNLSAAAAVGAARGFTWRLAATPPAKAKKKRSADEENSGCREPKRAKAASGGA